MRRTLRIISFSTALFTTTVTLAQNDRFAYAITDLAKDGAGWNALRRLDLQTGAYSTVLLNGHDQKMVAYDAATKKEIAAKADARFGNLLQMPFGTGVAAAAYDRKHNRLYFTPMFIDQLRYIDLTTMKLYHVSDQPLTGLGNMHNNEGKIITRMVIAPDGNGYAVTNDGEMLVQFTTGKKAKITQLGSLVDDPANNGISIHNRCSSFGGDMIADDDGNLYILSARNHVFKVSTSTKVARHLGAIEGLPQNFTVNGAVVDAEGALLVSSAVDGKAYYSIDTKSWKAAPYALASAVFRSSDLANSNFLSTSKTTTIETIAARNSIQNRAIGIYPNPVTTNRFTVHFNKVPAGDYTIEVVDIMGRSVLQKRTNIAVENQTQAITLNKTAAKGTYLVRLVDRSNRSLFEQKVLVQ